MVDFSKPGTIVAVVTIALFVFSMFAVLLSTPQGQAGSSSPTPSATPSNAFSGYGRGKASVTSLLNQFLIQCNSSENEKVSAKLGQVEGFSGSFVVASGIFVASLNSSFGENYSAVQERVLDAQIALEEYCDAKLLRKGTVKFEDSLVVNDDAGKANKTVFTRDIEAFANSVGSPQGIPVFLQASSRENESVSIVFSAKLEAGRLSQWFGQQPNESPTELKTVVFKAFILESYPVAEVSLQVPWQERAADKDSLRVQANASSSFNLTSLSYSPYDSVFLENLSENESLNAIALLKNQSFVTDVFASEGKLVVSVQGNYTSSAEFEGFVSSSGLNASVVFPNSTVSAKISFANGTLEQVQKAVSALFGAQSELFIEALVSPSFLQTDSKKAGFALPAAIPAAINPVSKDAYVITAEGRFLVQGTSVLRAQAKQVVNATQ